MKLRSLLLIAFLLAAALVVWSPASVASVSYVDHFDDDTVGASPTAPWYTYSDRSDTGLAKVSSLQSNTASNSIHILDQGTGSARAGFATTAAAGWDLCSALGHVDFNIRIHAFGSATQGVSVIISSGGFQTSGLPTITASFLASGTTITGPAVGSAAIAALSLDTWYHVIMEKTTGCTSSTSRTYVLSITDFGQVSETESFNYAGGSCAGSCKLDHIEFASQGIGTPDWNIDDISLENTNNPPPTSVSADATSSTFTNLNGFSVDRTGSLVIVRTDAGDQVRTLSSVDLSTQASEDTDCLRDDNVLSQMTPSGPLILYTDCDPSHNPDTFKLRTSAFQTTDLTGCGTGCADIDSNDFVSNADDDQTQFEQVQQFPIDFNDNHGIPLSGGTLWKTAWAWSGQGSRAGEVGIATYTNCQGPIGCLNYGELARVTFGGTSSAVADDICTSNDNSGFWMASADSTAPGKSYPVTWTNVSVHSGSYYALRAVIGSAATFPVSGPIGVACGHSLVAFVTSNQVSVWMRSGGGSPLWTASCSCEVRGVALSNLRSDGKQFISWLDGNTGYIAYATNGTTVGSVTYTHSGFTETKLQENAQSLYITSNNVVKRYPINAVTGVLSSNGTTITVSPVASGIFANSGAMIGASLGVGAFGGNLFLGVVCIGICAVGVGSAMRSVLGGIIGGILGFILSWAFGFFSTAVVFSMVVLGLLAFFFASRRGSAAE